MCCLSGTLFPEFPSHVKAPVNYTQSSRIIRENSMSRAPDWQPQFYLSPPFPLATFKGNLKAMHFIRASAFHTTHSLTLHRIEAYQLPHRHSQKEDARGYSEKKGCFIWVMENIGRHLWTIHLHGERLCGDSSIDFLSFTVYCLGYYLCAIPTQYWQSAHILMWQDQGKTENHRVNWQQMRSRT